MKRFDKDGKMIFPSPKKEDEEKKQDVLLIEECFCPNGHNLISKRVVFNDFNGVLIKIKNNKKEGLIALSPIYGDKSKISIDIDLENGEIYDFYCNECGVKLPVYSQCTCGGDIIAFYSDKSADFTNCIGICNRVGCKHAEIKLDNELLELSGIQ
ncbi:MAG: hypothetical protein KAT68_04610 [Bacteroidales bacterium]|nr:hypothetical protein [Bacteroidales bacterium]